MLQRVSPTVRRAKLRVLPEDWTAADDNKLRDTKGKYAKIAALSDKMQIAESALITRWHRLRSDSVKSKAPKKQSVDKANMKPVPTYETARAAAKAVLKRSQHVELADAILSHPGCSPADLGARLGTSAQNAARYVSEMRERLLRVGWTISTCGKLRGYQFERKA
ncbi:MarR family transcriptional regulator [Roseovarius pacificus]|uniref:MarR family transcriptional regulator n=1 Tax=Roseovarius pacificus TaxID=337701 RepID=UPI00403A6525